VAVLSALRAAPRPESNVSLAVPLGRTANGSDDERSDVDLPTALSDSDDMLTMWLRH
jgi:hypothetical protein